MSTNSDPPSGCPLTGPGALYNPMVSPHREDPYPVFARLRQEEPVCHSPLFNMWLISRHDDVAQMLGDPRRFTAEGAFSKLSAAFQPEAWALLSQAHTFTALNMLISEREHTRLRGPLSKFFAAQQIARHEPMIRRCAASLIDGLAPGGPVDLIEQFAYPFPLQVLFELVGVPVQDMAEVRRGVEAVAACMLSVVPPDQQVEAARRVLAYERYWMDQIAQRRARPRDDLISMLVQAVDAGEAALSPPEMVATISANLILGGHETTVKAIGNGLYHLLTRRERWQALIDDPGLIPGAAEELLRLDGVSLGFFRTTTEPVEVRGVTIPRGETVLLLYASANRDEGAFERPEEFDPRRPNLKDHVAFGRGVHYCLGAHLARLELRIALELLTTRLPGLRLVPDQELRYTSSLSLRGLEHLLATRG
jgi:cytochrome P450